METNKVYTPKHHGGGVVFCSNCEKSFVDNVYYEYCPRCGCRIRESKYIINGEKDNDK